MKRVVYSLYIDIPKEDIDIFDKNILKEGDTPINIRTKEQFKLHYGDLCACKEIYANQIGADFKMFEYDTDFMVYSEKMKHDYPYLTMYNIINFYKIHLMYELGKTYDEILYLDFDVVPIQNINFFEHWDLTKGIAVLNNNDKIGTIESHSESSQTIRSPSSKFYNAQAMLFEKNMSTKNDVINTGIVGINKEHLDKLDYFKNFEDNLTMMTHLKIQIRDEVVYPNNEHGEVKIKKKNDKYVTNIFPDKIRQYFGWDNETLFSVKLKENNVPVQWLDDKWHYFLYNQGFIPAETILCHTINKNFELVWRRLNA
jgi:hypothetical protein|tara:strand:- start:5303 stop:6241 length:939 start_codon:yes stop_codon:yes gene_type:complete